MVPIRVFIADGQAVFDSNVATRLISGQGNSEPDPRDGLKERLSDREVEVLRLMTKGFSNKEIARALWIGETTVPKKWPDSASRERHRQAAPLVRGAAAGDPESDGRIPALRLGIQQALDLVVQEMGEPAVSELRRAQAESRLGLSIEEALEKMAERLDSDDFRWTVTAIAIQRDVGGNLAEVLDVLANTMRERAELRRHVHALTSEGRLSAIILFLLPFVMVTLLFVVNPGYISTLFTTPVGLTLLVFGGLLLIIGGVWLNRATKVEV